LSILLIEAGTSKDHIARKLGLAPSAISERICRLEMSGRIKRYEARLDCRAQGNLLLAFVFVAEAKPTHGHDTGQALSQVTGVRTTIVLKSIAELPPMSGHDLSRES
jgi:Lrp/AsnC family transcriptional regulator, leucine-responsive regulatory protein